MAIDYVDILRRIEAAFPIAIGGSSRDETLRTMLVPWANDIFRELETRKRTPLLWKTVTQNTGTSPPPLPIYQLDVSLRTVDRYFYLQANGLPKFLDRVDRHEGLRRWGQYPAPVGTPVAFAVVDPWAATGDLGTFDIQDTLQIQIFPTPDTAGPGTSGTYPLQVVGTGIINDIVESVGNITATQNTLVVTSGPYCTNRGVANANVLAFISVRGAGAIGPDGVGDSLVTHWTALAANTFTLQQSAITTVNAAQVFFYSVNWIIKLFPRLFYAAMLREVASRLKDDAALSIWQQRYMAELATFDDFDADRLADIQTYATGQFGQRQMQESPNDPVSPASASITW